MNMNEWFRSLDSDTVEREGTRLLRLEREWHDRVPERADRAAKDVIALSRFAALAVLLSPLLLRRPAFRPVGRLVSSIAGKIVAAALIVAVTVSAGVLVVSPELQSRLGIRGGTEPRQTELAAEPRTYRIPSPGEQFTVTENGEGDQVRYIWFTSEDQIILVEVLNYYPEEMTRGAEAISVGGTPASYSEGGNAKTLVVQDGDISLVIQASGFVRDEILAYAGLLLEANR